MSTHAEPRCRAALLLVDVINDMDFPGAEALVAHALPMAHRLKDLKRPRSSVVSAARAPTVRTSTVAAPRRGG
jgi:hypothetical protein